MNTYAPEPQQMQPTSNPLAPKPVGAGALSLGTAATLGFVLMAGGGVGGGLLGAKLSKKHQTGATIVGTLLGAFVLPMIVGPIIGAAAGGVSGVNAPPAAGG